MALPIAACLFPFVRRSSVWGFRSFPHDSGGVLLEFPSRGEVISLYSFPIISRRDIILQADRETLLALVPGHTLDEPGNLFLSKQE